MNCLSCDGDGAPQNGLPPVLLARARRIEVGFSGERASEEEWQIFAGLVSGALPWERTVRLMGCVEEAARGTRSVLVCR